jgi:hypothetical protein
VNWSALVAVSTPSPSPTSVHAAASGSGTSPWILLLVAIIGFVGVATTAAVQGRIGRRANAAMDKTAEAARLNSEAAATNAENSRISADAASRSAQAAQDAVGVNAESAAGIARRAEAAALAGRYHDAAEQLGHEQAPVRLAGVYAMARLADDWVDQRQSCIDVLCAYLRMPRSGDAGDDADTEVRLSIVRLIESNVASYGVDGSRQPGPWSNLAFNFNGAAFRDFRLSQPYFSEEVSFDRAKFSGECWISAPIFERGALLSDAQVENGALRLPSVSGNNAVSARGLRIAETGLLSISTEGTGASIILDDCSVSGRLKLSIKPDGYAYVSGRDITVNGRSSVIVETSWADGAEIPVTQWLRIDGWAIATGASIRLPVDTKADWITDLNPTEYELHFGRSPAN